MHSDTCHEAEAAIQKRLDASLSRQDDERLNDHLEGCAACRELAGDLESIVSATAGIEPEAPPPVVWERLAARLADGPPSIAVVPHARAASPAAWGRTLGLAAMVCLAVGAGVIVGLRLPTTEPAADAPLTAVIAQVETDLAEAEAHYSAAVQGLADLAARPSELGAEEADGLRQHLALLDRMIAESRTALAANPANVAAGRSLLNGVTRKFVLLDEAVFLLDSVGGEL